MEREMPAAVIKVLHSDRNGRRRLRDQAKSNALPMGGSAGIAVAVLEAVWFLS